MFIVGYLEVMCRLSLSMGSREQVEFKFLTPICQIEFYFLSIFLILSIVNNNILCSMKEFWRGSFVKLFCRSQLNAAHKFWCIINWLYIVHCLLDHFSKNLKNGKITEGGLMALWKIVKSMGTGTVFWEIFLFQSGSCFMSAWLKLSLFWWINCFLEHEV